MKNAVNDVQWRRFAGACGLVFVILLVAGHWVAPLPNPKSSDSASHIQQYFVQNRMGEIVKNYLAVIAVFFFLLFSWALRIILRNAEGEPADFAELAWGGGLLTGVVDLVGSCVYIALAFKVAEMNDLGVVRAMFDLGTVAFQVVWIPLVLLVGATSVLALRTRVLPAWLGWAGYAVSVVMLAATSAMFVASGPLYDLELIALFAFIAWSIAISIVLVVARAQTATQNMVADSPAVPVTRP